VKSYPYSSYGNRNSVKYTAASGNGKVRNVRVRVVNFGVLPETHPAKGKPAWVFADEIVVN
jgi:hypothetical protein